MTRIPTPFGADDLFAEESAEHAVLDLHAIAKRAKGRVRDELKAKVPIDLLLGSVPDVTGPMADVYQVLVNILLNAEDVASREGGEDARVILETRPGSQGCAVVEVRAARGRNADANSARKSVVNARPSVRWEGFGLGVCEKMLASVRGTIALEDHPDGTTRFRITLPPPGGAPVSRVPSSNALPSQGALASNGPKRRTTREFTAVSFVPDKEKK